MEEYISRHEIDREFWAKDEEKSNIFLPGIVQNLSKSNDFSFLYTKSLTYLHERVALDKGEAAIREALHLASKAITNCFLFATGRATKTSFSLEGKEEVRVEKNEKFKPENYTEDIDYIKALYLAALADDETLNQLTEIEVEELDFSGNRTDAFFSDYANFLRSVFNRDGKAGDWLTKAFKGTFPDQIQFGNPEYLEHNEVEHLKVWIALLGGDADKFNAALQSALQKHKAYWSRNKALTKGGVIPQNDETGFFSLPLTAICKIAHRSGIPVQVKSDYLAEVLVFGG